MTSKLGYSRESSGLFVYIAIMSLIVLGVLAYALYPRSVDAAPRANDSPALVFDMPQEYENIAAGCIGGNGIYQERWHNRTIVIVDDPECKPDGALNQLRGGPGKED